ncbi:hypothetical protein BJP27_24350 (plasmid) [Pseudomonas oryzihabitans]|nr:hypothetical protein BJP27_24350 [Pseudomonas psychrotolerans]
MMAKRLTAARRAARMNQIQVAEKLGQKQCSQVSQWEDPTNERMPKLADLIAMAKLYSVPMDYLVCLSDDMIADATENNQSFLARMVSNAIADAQEQFTQAMSQKLAVTIQGHGQDRSDLQAIALALRELKQKITRMQELNPGYDEDWRGYDPVRSALERCDLIVRRADQRIAQENRHCDIIDKELAILDGEFERRQRRSVAANVGQMVLEMSPVD